MHEIAALKRAGRMPRTEQLYDAPLIAEVGQMFSADIAFYTRTIKRPCAFTAAGPEPLCAVEPSTPAGMPQPDSGP